MFGDLRRFDSGPLRGADRFRELLDELFPDPGLANIRSVPAGSYPMINIGRTDDAVRVYVFAAGLSADDMEISIQDNVLTLQGRRTDEDAGTQDNGRRPYFRRERIRGEFARSIALPEGLDADRAEARSRNGVFVIHLPKREELKPRRIEIQSP
ncbi:Hsp20/alpha crystallin family protein [Halomonas alkalisoli]|uniref:Hsp20/alpha crystallin family protein n=1 Tax=Halomonas alkalisoli TaxID=2907158 RepID=UPI001F375FE2|nr:Hsp20/alpha crystallin family protein [Halomonas alkalisoli]MCE9682398.1 Hsp20/alpha crystallin family protein [Halomonas alkalisoli]